jgi:hypothetical protein
MPKATVTILVQKVKSEQFVTDGMDLSPFSGYVRQQERRYLSREPSGTLQ